MADCGACDALCLWQRDALRGESSRGGASRCDVLKDFGSDSGSESAERSGVVSARRTALSQKCSCLFPQTTGTSDTLEKIQYETGRSLLRRHKN